MNRNTDIVSRDSKVVINIDKIKQQNKREGDVDES